MKIPHSWFMINFDFTFNTSYLCVDYTYIRRRYEIYSEKNFRREREERGGKCDREIFVAAVAYSVRFATNLPAIWHAAWRVRPANIKSLLRYIIAISQPSFFLPLWEMTPWISQTNESFYDSLIVIMLLPFKSPCSFCFK